MTKGVVILGRQPALGLAELESLFGADNLKSLGEHAALLDVEAADVPIARLGGTIKVCKLLTELPFADWRKITDYLVMHVPKHTCCYGPGKVTFGISAYGFKVNPKAINATSLAVKKAVKATGRPIRVVPNKDPALNSAQVLHNKMTDLPLGMELILLADGNRTWLAQTVAVQDIEAYAARDQKRPRRDARVGMLPPKLAQIIINLAVGEIENHELRVMSQEETILDPFCGTGVILQEAVLMGYRAYGTDLEPRMAEYSHTNLDWIQKKYAIASKIRIEKADAVETQWKDFDTVAAETYLGQPFSALPSPEKLQNVMHTCNLIHSKFLKNIRMQTKPGFRMCIAMPAWQTKNGFKHLGVLDSLDELGYNRLKFVHATWDELIYHRPGQIVARELVVLERK